MGANQPIFEKVFGDDWDNMPIIFKKHYQNRPYSNDITNTKGVMNIYIAPILQPIAPFLALTQTLIAKKGDNIDVLVKFKSGENDEYFRFEREFAFPDKTRRFYSTMERVDDKMIIEWTKSGIGWGCEFKYKDNQVSLLHRGYFMKLFGKPIRIPVELIAGRGFAYERAIDDNNFEMYMEIKHFLFGKTYSYSGTFYIE